MRKSLFCATLALVLSAGGGTALAQRAQRRAPAGGRHATAVHRGSVGHRGAIVSPRRSVTIHSRLAGPVFVARPPVYRSHFYRPYAYRPRYRSSFSVGLYFGSPYRYYYPYTYPTYAYPYYYPYTYPPVSVYPYPYTGSVSVAPVTPQPSTEPDDSADERIVAPEDTGQDVRGFVAITDAPADATIYVDGNYAGHAADFTAEQPLSEPAGVHQLEIRAPGQRTVIVHIDVQPGRVLSYAYPQ